MNEFAVKNMGEVMKNKNTKEDRTLRTKRKNCINKIGKEKYNFNSKEEFIKYKYMCCVQMKKREWKKCREYDVSYSYSEWKGKIREKYNIYSKSQLEEFSRYLKLGVCDNNISREIKSVVWASLLSSAFAVVFENIVFPKNQGRVVWIAIVLFIFLVAIAVWGMLIIIFVVYTPIQNSNLEKEMYSDYQEIINELIREKSAKHHLVND
jgi:hypothetical protein|nr:MAG TPA: hypothetical protein [Caudoviricetes sp.]